MQTYRGLNEKEKKKTLMFSLENINVFKTMKGIKLEIESPKKVDIFFLLDELNLIEKLGEKIKAAGKKICEVANER